MARPSASTMPIALQPQRQQLYPAALGLRPHQQQGIADQAGDVAGFEVEVIGAGIDLGKVQHFGDQKPQMIAAGMDGFGIIGIAGPGLRGIAQHIAPDHLRKAQNGVERRAQLMAHGGEELRFQPVGGFGRFLGQGQHRFAFLQRRDIGKGDGIAAIGEAVRRGQIPASAHRQFRRLARQHIGQALDGVGARHQPAKEFGKGFARPPAAAAGWRTSSASPNWRSGCGAPA